MQVSPQLPLFLYDTARLALYRTTYQPTDGGKRIRRMTFAAPDAEHAASVAEDWELRGDRLLNVKPISRE